MIYGILFGKYFFKINKTYLDYDANKLGMTSKEKDQLIKTEHEKYSIISMG